MQNVLAILLAGGTGERLHPLTQNIAKPAVPFGGTYRLIDFTLSNCLNSGIRRVFVLTQYKSLELNRHIREGWQLFSREIGEFIDIIPPMKRVHHDWYRGTADAVYQNVESILDENPETTLLLGSDHIYKMDYQEMIDWHRHHNADVTIGTLQIPPAEAPRFGVAAINQDHLVTGFEEKPKHGHPSRSVFNPEMVSASMGIYAFRTEYLIQCLIEDAACENSAHDFGHNIIPSILDKAKVVAYDFRDLNDKTAKYWRDVGTLDAYYEANMDLVSVLPEFNLYDRRWPIRTRLVQAPPAKFVFASEGRRMGIALDSIVSHGCIISGGRVTRCILSPGVRVNSYSDIDSSILMEHVEVRRNCRIHRAVIAPNVVIPEESTIGFDLEADRAKGYTVTDEGVVVIPPPAWSRPLGTERASFAR